MKMNRHIIPIASILFFLMFACSDSSTDPDLDDETGKGIFSLSGDIEGQFEGEAVFGTVGAEGFFTAVLGITDDSEQDSFSLMFTAVSTGAISVPAGTYIIGLPHSEVPNGSVFIASLTDFTGIASKIFQTTEENSGKLKVSRFTDGILEGSFQYDASRDAGEEVMIEGSFSAEK